MRLAEPHEVNGADEPLADVEEPPARHWPCCQVGVMVVVQRIARPTVQEIMEMTLDQLRQLPLPFT